MRFFTFSCDSHVVEPLDLYTSNLPASLKNWAMHVERKDGYHLSMVGDTVVHRMKLPEKGDDVIRVMRKGSHDLKLRLEDMALDGIDAELVFSSIALAAHHVTDPEAELATAEIHNNWLWNYFKNALDKFVPVALLPVHNFPNTVAELKRAAWLGFTAAMLPAVTPEGVAPYNSNKWDEIFHLGGELGIPFCMHTSTGLKNLIFERGPGGAVYNYTRQMFDAASTITLLTAGGVLDRNPKAQTVFVESGASWLVGLAERMDETYLAHSVYVQPKLSMLPSKIVSRQVKCAFQTDKGAVVARKVLGHQTILWATDYPHMEGTFPNSQDVLKRMFEGVDISDQEKADIVGGTAARLFRLQRPEFQVEAVA
ncbi:MAG: amidohydrolase family protein [Rhizomicrobium sp.]